MKNTICICGAIIDNEVSFCKVCGLGLPELKVIELKSPKEVVPTMMLSEKQYQELKEMKIYFNKLSELF